MGLSLLAGILLGIAGSLHCVGMCGPLVMMVSGGIGPSVVYHIGRTFCYSILGLFFSWIFQLADLSAIEQSISLVFGGIFFILAIGEWSGKFHLNQLKLLRSSSGTMNLFGNLFGKSGLGWKFLAGMMNGLLPCGMVYAALIASMAQNGPLGGGVFMAGFGLATMPSLLFVGAFSNYFKSFLKRQTRNLFPLWLLIMALIFLLRGLNLGIPFVSPRQDKMHQTGGNCCEK
jgi:sulfite exporter TauE/SafE